MYIQRAIEDTIKKYGKGFKATMVTGPRQVGKSTVLQHLFEKQKYITFDDPLLRSQIIREPGLFFLNNRPPLILDEVQYIAELFPYIKMECDKTKAKGRFYLTGSQQFHLMRNVSESLAGRVGILELAGLSMRELTGTAFHEPFVPTQEYISKREKKLKHMENMWEVIHRGGFPALQDENVDWQVFYGSYVQTYIERDINELASVQDKLKFTQFLTAMAARTGQLLNYANVAEQIEVSATTVKEWTSLLETSGLVYIMPPYFNSALKRAIKTPKIYFRDTGLVCYLTRHLTSETAMNGVMAGALFETFVVSEILKSYSNAGRNYRLNITYYRGKDKERRVVDGEKTVRESEIDLLIEENGTLYPVEIKMTANPNRNMTNAFDVIDRIKGMKRGMGVVLCMYENPIYLSKDTMALPIEYI